MSSLQENRNNLNILTKFTAKNGQEYQACYANENHAESIVELFKDVYHWNYLYPFVYFPEKVKAKIKKPNQIWCIATPIESDEVVGLSVIKKNRISLHVSKVNIKKKYQGRGIGSGLGANAFTAIIGKPKFRDIKRLESDVRATNLNSQKFIEKTGSKPYGFIPNYNNYDDKRKYSPNNLEPFTNGRIEPVIMYASRFNTFWNMRDKNITLFDNEDILFHYDVARSNNRKMKRDNLIIKINDDFELDQYYIEEDFYKSCVKFEGFICKDTLNDLLKKYNNWNVIEWKIPVNKSGLNSQKIALDNGFVVLGYDSGSILYKKLQDTLLVGKFPNGVDPSQFEQMDLTPTNKKIAERVIKAL